MQVKNYANKYQIPVSDVIETLSVKFNKTVWQPSSDLKTSHTALLDSVFGNHQLQLPPNELNFPGTGKEQLQLPPSESESSQLQTTLPSGDLAEHLQVHSSSLTATDVEALQATVQTSIIEERAELAAIRDFQAYKATYADTTRALVVNDIYQKLDARNLARKKFEEEQNQLAVQNPNPEKSSDLMSEMLGILKADKYKSDFLTSKLEQI
ncbi:hypothetical protein [Nostoc sp. 2RC]|uniref:hypothetical protein n=1 Tax=Nostoc sp. 2RC TaxID=2485484 RepID=UPI001628A721|nr:hypothetical protein [Nostoc sp. 2RC]MBC1238503.1 hypothetical protein [Nostoc sp. 2RC]